MLYLTDMAESNKLNNICCNFNQQWIKIQYYFRCKLIEETF